MQYDFVVYNKYDKHLICLILDLTNAPRFLINKDYVGLYIPHDEYQIVYHDDIAYFENLNEKILWLDDYRKNEK